MSGEQDDQAVGAAIRELKGLVGENGAVRLTSWSTGVWVTTAVDHDGRNWQETGRDARLVLEALVAKVKAAIG